MGPINVSTSFFIDCHGVANGKEISTHSQVFVAVGTPGTLGTSPTANLKIDSSSLKKEVDPESKTFTFNADDVGNFKQNKFVIEWSSSDTKNCSGENDLFSIIGKTADPKGTETLKIGRASCRER